MCKKVLSFILVLTVEFACLCSYSFSVCAIGDESVLAEIKAENMYQGQTATITLTVKQELSEDDTIPPSLFLYYSFDPAQIRYNGNLTYSGNIGDAVHTDMSEVGYWTLEISELEMMYSGQVRTLTVSAEFEILASAGENITFTDEGSVFGSENFDHPLSDIGLSEFTFTVGQEYSRLTVEGENFSLTDDGRLRIKCTAHGMTAGEVCDNISSSVGVGVVDSAGRTVGENAKVMSGYAVRTFSPDGGVAAEYPIVIVGDVLPDGIINAKDVITLKMILSGREGIDGFASDVNGDGVTDVQDVIAVAQTVSGT